jgi:hypothetical protein
MDNVRARSNSELVDAAFELYRRKFSVFLTLGAISLVPMIPATMLKNNASSFEAEPLSVVIFGLVVISFAISCLGAAAVSRAAGRAYLGDESIDVGSAIGYVLQRPVRIILATLLKGLIFTIGFIFLVIPGFFAMKSYFAVPATLVMEKPESSREALKRSHEVSKGWGKRIFLVLLPTWLLYMIAVTVVGAAFQLAAGDSVWAEVIMMAVYAATYPIIEIITTLLYLDIRVRSEGYDIELMAKGLDANLAS